MVSATTQRLPVSSAPRKPLLGFFLAGLLMSLPAAILPTWGYHLATDYSRIGSFFLAMTLGCLLAVPISQKLLRHRGISFTMMTGSAAAALGLVYLSIFTMPDADLWRYGGFLVIGLAASLLSTATFHAISALFRQDPAATINISGTLFGLGCLITAVLINMTFEAGDAFALFAIAATAGVSASVFAGLRFPNDPVLFTDRPFGQDFNNPGAILFGLLLFFQFGNEWSVAGWLSMFLIHRLGISPSTSLTVLAVYWLALLLGRILAQWMLGRMRHGRMLVTNAAAAMVGCTILALTDNLFGTVLGVVLVGLAFASTYPLVIERIGKRFPYYHPGVFNGIFTFAMLGGMLAPWTLGYFANYFGIQVVMVLPMVGTCAVLLLLLIIWLEGKFSGSPLLR